MPTITHSWEGLGLRVETTRHLEEDGLRRPSVQFTSPTTMVISYRSSSTHRTTMKVQVYPKFLLLLVLFGAGGACSFNIGGMKLPPGTARQAAGSHMQQALPARFEPAEVMSHAAQLLSAGGQLAMQAGGASLLAACTRPVLQTDLSMLPAGVERIVRGDVERLHSALQAVLCGSEGCDVGQFNEMLASWAARRAPILHWSAARCLERLSGAVGAQLEPQALLKAPTLAEALAPLTREAAPLLASCLFASPWRLCRLAFRYLAFMWAPRARKEILPKLLHDVAAALEASDRSGSAQPKPFGDVSSPTDSDAAAADAYFARHGRGGTDVPCARAAAATVGGWNLAAIGVEGQGSQVELRHAVLTRCVQARGGSMSTWDP